MRNRARTDNTLVRAGLQELRRRLPPGWSASPQDGAAVEVTAPDRRKGRLALDARARLTPKDVRPLVDGLTSERATPVVVAPFLTESTRARLRERGVSYLDLTGNARIVLPVPGLFIETQGASEDPNREERPARSLRGPKAGRVVRALIELKAAPGVRELAALTKTDAGYVSRVLSFLDSEALITRVGRGRIASVDWPTLLRRWAEEAPLDARGKLRTFLEPRGLSMLQTRLVKLDALYAITGSLAAATLAPLAPARLATLWVRDTGSCSRRTTGAPGRGERSRVGQRAWRSGYRATAAVTGSVRSFGARDARSGHRQAGPQPDIQRLPVRQLGSILRGCRRPSPP